MRKQNKATDIQLSDIISNLAAQIAYDMATHTTKDIDDIKKACNATLQVCQEILEKINTNKDNTTDDFTSKNE